MIGVGDGEYGKYCPVKKIGYLGCEFKLNEFFSDVSDRLDPLAELASYAKIYMYTYIIL